MSQPNPEQNKSLTIRVLSEDQIWEIKRAALEVLAKTGCRVQHQAGVKLLKQAGAIVKEDLVKVPEHVVEQCISSAPKGFTIYNREGHRAMELEDRKSYYGSSTAAPNTRDAITGEIRETRLSDIVLVAKVADALPHISFAMPFGSAQDVQPKLAEEVHEFEAVVTHTTKPVMFPSQSTRAFEMVYEMAAEIAGGLDALREKPFLIAFPEPITPLVFPHDTVERVLYAAKLGMPQYCGPIAQLGVTGPVTLAGSLVLVVAESLMSITLAQLQNNGSPCLQCAGVVPFDMRNGTFSVGGPELSLCRIALAQIAQSYGLPTFAIAGTSDSKIPDAQAGIECAFSLLAQRLAGLNLIHGLGYLAGGMICSAEMLVLGDEAAGMVERLIRGIDVNAGTLARDLIHKVGPGGNFLQEEHTLNNFRKELWIPSLMSRETCDAWRDRGAKDVSARAREKIVEILETHKVTPLPDRVVAALERIKQMAIKELAVG